MKIRKRKNKKRKKKHQQEKGKKSVRETRQARCDKSARVALQNLSSSRLRSDMAVLHTPRERNPCARKPRTTLSIALSTAATRTSSPSSRSASQSACSASECAAACSRTWCTPDAAPPSSWSLPSCGRRAWSDHQNPSACGRNDAYLCCVIVKQKNCA